MLSEDHKKRIVALEHDIASLVEEGDGVYSVFVNSENQSDSTFMVIVDHPFPIGFTIEGKGDTREDAVADYLTGPKGTTLVKPINENQVAPKQPKTPKYHT